MKNWFAKIWRLKGFLIGFAWTIAVVSVGIPILRVHGDLGMWLLLIPSGALGWVPAFLMDFNEPEHSSVEFRIRRARAYIEALEKDGDNREVIYVGGDPRDDYKVPILRTLGWALGSFMMTALAFVCVWLFVGLARY